MFDVQINYIAVIVAAGANMIIGWLWYGPVFGKQWIRLMGFTKEQMEIAKTKGMAKSYVIALLSAFVTAYVLAHFTGYMATFTFGDAATLAFWI